MSQCEERHKAILGHLLWVANQVAILDGIDKSGYRVVINNGDHAGMAVHHLHVHVIGGKQLGWPPG
jgi:histidine triad (HIT) family protein